MDLLWRVMGISGGAHATKKKKKKHVSHTFIYKYMHAYMMAGIWINEEDMAMYTIMAVDDPRTLNKTLYLRPPGNILTQLEVVRIWEKMIGKELKKTFVSEEDWLATTYSK